jgi:hypothetical protein
MDPNDGKSLGKKINHHGPRLSKTASLIPGEWGGIHELKKSKDYLKEKSGGSVKKGGA